MFQMPDPAAETALTTQWRAVVELRRSATAIQDRDVELTFGEVDDSSAKATAALYGTEDPVAVLGDLGAPVIVAMLAVIRAGRPLVVLDPTLPDDRIATIVVSSGATDLVVSDGHHHRVTALDNVRIVELSELGVTFAGETGGDVAGSSAQLREQSGPLADVDSLAAASIVYTSGSTGQPKGVVLSHRAVVNGARLSREHFDLSADDRILMVLPHGFAAGQEIIFMALLNGVTLCATDPRTHGLRDALQHVRQWEPTTVHLTPSLLRSVIGHTKSAEDWPAVRLFTTCGEAVHAGDIQAARRVFPTADYVNYLGSSETGHLAFHHIAADEQPDSTVIPAGRPVHGKDIRIMTDTGVPVEPGEIGRLEVNSRFLASGYHGVGAPGFQTEPDGTTTFRSGDLARIDPDGSLVLLGRSDSAIKVRGYLVEPAEIEGALTGLDEVIESVVQAVTGEDGVQRLVAYVSVDPHRRTPAVSALRRHLIDVLPAWMVPSDFVIIDVLPRNERGKVDRSALPGIETRALRKPPATQWEIAVASIWSRVLGADQIGRDESFIGLGGDSLAVEEMLAVVHAELGKELTSLDLANAPTVEEFAEVLAGGQPATAASVSKLVAAFSTEGTQPPVFCFAGAGGTALLFHQLAAQLSDDRPVYAIQMQGYENFAMVDWSVRAAAARYFKIINELAPTGSVVLVGHSLGGLFALEIAQLLRQAGRPDPKLVLLDTVLPPSTAIDSGDAAPVLRIPGMKGQTRWELWKTRFQLLVIGLYPYRGALRDSVFFQHGLRLTDRYRPTIFDGDSLVMLTAENIDDRRWWTQVVASDRPIIEVECNHVDILKTPYVERVGAEILAALGEWETRDGRAPSN